MFYFLSKPPLIYVLIMCFSSEDCTLPVGVCALVCEYKLCGSYVHIIFVIVMVLLHVVFIFITFSNKELFYNFVIFAFYRRAIASIFD